MTEEDFKKMYSDTDVYGVRYFTMNKIIKDFIQNVNILEELEKEVIRQRNENLDIINKYTGFAETDRRTIAELEAQIEKMKCCGNCDFIFRDGNCYYDKECKNKDHWKLRR